MGTRRVLPGARQNWKIGIYEVDSVFDALSNIRSRRDPDHPWLDDLTYVKNMTDLGGRCCRAYYVQDHWDSVSIQTFTAGWWEEFLAKELLGKWKGARERFG